ncbi:hypothetical protein H6761_00220 [Candidatus Nomurabacteria bacterium]|nr:hypothetical protein [Candidatus Nomurabacteria bacterium]
MSKKRKSPVSFFILRLLSIVAFFVLLSLYGCRLNFFSTICQEHLWFKVVLIILAIIVALLSLFLVIRAEINGLLGTYSDDLAKIGKADDLKEE